MNKALILGTVLALALVACSKPEQTSAPPPAAPTPASAPSVQAPLPPAAPDVVPPTAAAPAPATAQGVTQAATGKFASLVNAFQSADPATLGLVQKAASQLTAGQYNDALKTLAQVAAKPDLTADQKSAVDDATATAQKDAAGSLMGDVKKKIAIGN